MLVGEYSVIDFFRDVVVGEGIFDAEDKLVASKNNDLMKLEHANADLTFSDAMNGCTDGISSSGQPKCRGIRS